MQLCSAADRGGEAFVKNTLSSREGQSLGLKRASLIHPSFPFLKNESSRGMPWRPTG